MIVSDTSWEGYEDTPRDVIEGYQTIFAEIDDQLSLQSARVPTSLVVLAGVGGLAAAGARWVSRRPPPRPSLVAVKSGAAGPTGLRAAFRCAPDAAAGVFGARPIVVVTEGVTDAVTFERVVGRSPRARQEDEVA